MDGWINWQLNRGMSWDNSNKKKMDCARTDAQINPSNIFWKKSKLLLTLTSGLTWNLLEFHTSLEHIFHRIYYPQVLGSSPDTGIHIDKGRHQCNYQTLVLTVHLCAYSSLFLSSPIQCITDSWTGSKKKESFGFRMLVQCHKLDFFYPHYGNYERTYSVFFFPVIS